MVVLSMGSPFERVLPMSDRASLPAALRAQFLGTPDDGREAFLRGARATFRTFWTAPWTTLASRAIAGSLISYSSMRTSNEHFPSRWVYRAPGASKLVAPSRSA